MALTEEERFGEWRAMMGPPHRLCPPDVDKAQFRAAINAMDDWVDANAASLNAALPQPYRSSATPAQKGELLRAVVRRRTGAGPRVEGKVE